MQLDRQEPAYKTFGAVQEEQEVLVPAKQVLQEEEQAEQAVNLVLSVEKKLGLHQQFGIFLFAPIQETQLPIKVVQVVQ